MATHCEGGAAEPTTARGLTFVPGVTGEAVYVGQHGKGPYEEMPLLEYDAGRHFAGDGGTVMFWVSPDWDGYFTDPIHFDTYFLFAALGGREVPDFTSRDVPPNSGCDRLWLFMWNWLRCDLFEEPGKPLASLAWRCRNTWLRGDWWHVAITWQSKGWSKLYVNGVPRATRAHARLSDIQRFHVGSLPRVWTQDYRANAAFDELSIYQRALTDEEIEAEFHRIAPLAWRSSHSRLAVFPFPFRTAPPFPRRPGILTRLSSAALMPQVAPVGTQAGLQATFLARFATAHAISPPVRLH